MTVVSRLYTARARGPTVAYTVRVLTQATNQEPCFQLLSLLADRRQASDRLTASRQRQRVRALTGTHRHADCCGAAAAAPFFCSSRALLPSNARETTDATTSPALPRE